MADQQPGMTVDQYYDKFKQALGSNDPNAVSFANQVGDKYGKLGRKVTRQEFVGLMMDQGIIDAPSDLPADKLQGVLQGLQGTAKGAAEPTPKKDQPPGPPPAWVGKVKAGAEAAGKPLIDYIPGARKAGEWLAGSLAVPPMLQQAAEKVPDQGAGSIAKGYIGFQKGVAEGFADVGMDMTSPTNLAMAAGTFLTGKATRAVGLFNKIRKLASAGFTLAAAKDLAKESPEAYRMIQAGDYEGAGKAAARSVADLMVGAESFKAGRRIGAPDKSVPRATPTDPNAPFAERTNPKLVEKIAKIRQKEGTWNAKDRPEPNPEIVRHAGEAPAATPTPPPPEPGAPPVLTDRAAAERSLAAKERAKQPRQYIPGLGFRVAPEETGELSPRKTPVNQPVGGEKPPPTPPRQSTAVPTVPQGQVFTANKLPGIPDGSPVVLRPGPAGTVVDMLNSKGEVVNTKTLPFRDSLASMEGKGWITRKAGQIFKPPAPPSPPPPAPPTTPKAIEAPAAPPTPPPAPPAPATAPPAPAGPPPTPKSSFTAKKVAAAAPKPTPPPPTPAAPPVAAPAAGSAAFPTDLASPGEIAEAVNPEIKPTSSKSDIKQFIKESEQAFMEQFHEVELDHLNDAQKASMKASWDELQSHLKPFKEAIAGKLASPGEIAEAVNPEIKPTSSKSDIKQFIKESEQAFMEQFHEVELDHLNDAQKASMKASWDELQSHLKPFKEAIAGKLASPGEIAEAVNPEIKPTSSKSDIKQFIKESEQAFMEQFHEVELDHLNDAQKASMKASWDELQSHLKPFKEAIAGKLASPGEIAEAVNPEIKPTSSKSDIKQFIKESEQAFMEQFHEVELDHLNDAQKASMKASWDELQSHLKPFKEAIAGKGEVEAKKATPAAASKPAPIKPPVAGPQPATASAEGVPQHITAQAQDLLKQIEKDRAGGDRWETVRVQPLAADGKTAIGPPLDIDAGDFSANELWEGLKDRKGASFIRVTDPDNSSSVRLTRPIAAGSPAPPTIAREQAQVR